MRRIKWSLKRLVEPLNGLNPTKHVPGRFKCLFVAIGILRHESRHSCFVCIELQRPVFVKGWIRVLLNNTTHLIFKIFHPLSMATDTGESVTDSRIARSRIGNDIYGCLIKSSTASIREIVCLQSVGEVEDNLAAIMREREWMRKDVLCVNTPRKVVAFPIRTIPRDVAFNNAVVIRYTGIAETRTPDALSRCIPKIFNNIYLKPFL